MSGIAFNLAAPLAGGELCSGMTLVLTMQMMWDHGLAIDIRHDKKRQILLNLICFICAVNTTISYGFNATKASVAISDVTTMITFLCVQYSLVILNHNTIIRATNIFSKGAALSRERLDRYCTALYFLPPIVLIPIYLAFADTAGTGKAMNTSTWNSLVFKPLNIVLVMVTAALATVTDILLLKKVDSHFVTLRQSTDQLLANPNKSSLPMLNVKPATAAGGAAQPTAATERNSIAMRKNLWVNYAIAWFLLVADVVLKSLIAAGVPLLFDSIVTILTVAMRSRCNLQFGLEMQKAFNQHGSSHKTNSAVNTNTNQGSTAVGALSASQLPRNPAS
ncbi:hypothetical protein BCR44DRAFT_1483032 [Catenaria anguillulae PL171]|uniref:Uncharacterized protein n=1 Tax=Catenaria anguillulae PL171 TaxID=765915 RepID=A0A1Y2HXD0_9FUNG|nr:hypothetical protein BCR44DRAFT_1483032 [Catenaria anguillulae PL171]